MFLKLALLLTLSTSSDAVRIVTLGDSITRGVRPGVKAEETFSAYLQSELQGRKMKATVINAGIGGERTDQALARLDQVVKTHRPHLVTLMYGHNDSHIDRGQTKPRLTVAQYEANLRALIDRLHRAKVQVVLMTPPCYSKKSRQGGVAENPNVQLVQYAEACRKVAKERKVPLVDHYAGWHRRLDEGGDVAEWTTDGYHPNPKGHRDLAERMVEVIVRTLR